MSNKPLDADTGQIVAAALTAKEVDDGAEDGPLLDQVSSSVSSFTADGAYDQEGVAAALAERHSEAAIIVPPRSTAMPSETAVTAPPLPFRALRAQNLGQLRPRSGTATCKASPSTDGQPGRKPPATRSGFRPRRPSADSSG